MKRPILAFTGIALIAGGTLGILSAFPVFSYLAVMIGIDRTVLTNVSALRMIVGAVVVGIGFFIYTRTWKEEDSRGLLG